ncbi:MAG TPA: hypothetical protein PL037_07550, partial [Elusimicrobiales bacterium]|nr:hypothetical protein [Elusimicrobiales bacterium]
MSRSAVGLLSVLLVLPAAASAAVPGTMNFQGRLLDTAKLPRNGLFQMTFRVCDSLAGSCAGTCQAGNPCLWSEDKNVPVFNGVFAVQLGSSTALDAEIFSSAGRYLEITVAGETMSPREPLASGPYSLRASVSDSLAVGALTDAQVAPAAGIAYSKLALTGSVQNSDLAGSIADSKLNTITAAGKVEPGAIASGSLPATVIASSLAVNSVTNGSQITDGIITNEDLAGSISPSKISGTAAILGANTFTGNQTLSDGVLLDMSGVDNSATTEGFRLPQATDVSAGTAEGQLAWDRDNDLLQIGTGAGIRTIGIPNNITVYNTAGNHTWTRPPGVSMVYVQVWGGGGG